MTSFAPLPKRIQFDATPGTYYPLVFANFIKSVLTLGVYRLFARHEVRRYLWAHTSFDGARFVYLGRARDALRVRGPASRIIALLFLSKMAIAFVSLSSLAVFALMIGWVTQPLTTLAAERYRLGQTSLRGVRFRLTGDTQSFVWLCVKNRALAAITLGWWSARAVTQERAWIFEHMRWGTAPFRYTGKAEDLFQLYWRGLVLCVATLGLYLPWHLTRCRNYHFSHVHLGEAKLASDAPGGTLGLLWLQNIALTLVTFGLASPWAHLRMHNFYLGHLTVEGHVDYARIEAAAQEDANEALGDLLAGGSLDAEWIS